MMGIEHWQKYCFEYTVLQQVKYNKCLPDFYDKNYANQRSPRFIFHKLLENGIT